MSEMISTVGTTLASDAPSKMSTVSSFFNNSIYQNNKLIIQLAVALVAVFLGYKFVYVPYFKKHYSAQVSPPQVLQQPPPQQSAPQENAQLPAPKNA